MWMQFSPGQSTSFRFSSALVSSVWSDHYISVRFAHVLQCFVTQAASLSLSLSFSSSTGAPSPPIPPLLSLLIFSHHAVWRRLPGFFVLSSLPANIQASGFRVFHTDCGIFTCPVFGVAKLCCPGSRCVEVEVSHHCPLRNRFHENETFWWK